MIAPRNPGPWNTCRFLFWAVACLAVVLMIGSGSGQHGRDGVCDARSPETCQVPESHFPDPEPMPSIAAVCSLSTPEPAYLREAGGDLPSVDLETDHLPPEEDPSLATAHLEMSW